MKTKNLLLLLFTLILIPFTQAYVGGETATLYHFENCVNMTVAITGSLEIDEGEYTLKNCSNLENNTWFCECSGSYDLLLQTKSNTINNYTIITNYTINTSIDNIDILDVFVVNKDIILYDMKYSNNKISFNLSSKGNKTVNISTGKFGCPHAVYVNNVNTPFTCSVSNVIFKTHFSDKLILLDYNLPTKPRHSSKSKNYQGVAYTYEPFNNETNETIKNVEPEKLDTDIIIDDTDENIEDIINNLNNNTKKIATDNNITNNDTNTTATTKELQPIGIRNILFVCFILSIIIIIFFALAWWLI